MTKLTLAFRSFVNAPKNQIPIQVLHWHNLPNESSHINHLNPTGYVMHHQFNIQQLYALPTLYLSENK